MTTKVQSNVDGSSSILNGAIEAIHIATSGKVAFPAGVVDTGPAFKATFQPIAVPTGLGSPTHFILLPAIDTDSAIANNRFNPKVAGYYSFYCNVSYANSGLVASNINAFIIKNDNENTIGANACTSGGFPGVSISTLLYLNGSTDYVTFATTHNAADTVTAVGGLATGFLVRAA